MGGEDERNNINLSLALILVSHYDKTKMLCVILCFAINLRQYLKCFWLSFQQVKIEIVVLYSTSAERFSKVIPTENGPSSFDT